MSFLKLNFDLVKYPHISESEKPISQKFLEIVSPSKSKFIYIPEGFDPDDYLAFLILCDFLQPNSNITLRDAVDPC